MKFKYTVSNPPYEQGMCNEFFNFTSEISDQQVYVMPSTPVVYMRPLNDSSGRELLEVVKSHKFSIELFDGNKVFDAQIWAPMGVFHLDTTESHTGVHVQGLYDAVLPVEQVNQFGEWVLKFYPLFGALPKLLDSVRSGDYYVYVGDIRGHVAAPGSRFHDDFFTFIPRALEPATERLENKPVWVQFGFSTKEEAENLIEYLKLKIPRFALALHKVNGHLSGNMGLVPAVDFTGRWTDAELCSKFGISAEDFEKIDSLIADYY